MVSQAGIARKITRAQVIDGLQPELALPSGTLLGRGSAGMGSVEQLAIGANLNLTNGTLVADAAPYVVSALSLGTVPSGIDMVGLGQSGTNTAVSYAQFMSGISGVGNLDASGMLVTAAGGSASATIANFAGGVLSKSGGTMTGALSLAGAPTSALAAATKQYVDGQVAGALSLSGGTLSGPLTLPPTRASRFRRPPSSMSMARYLLRFLSAEAPSRGRFF